MYHFDVKLKTTQIVFSLSITNRVNNYIRQYNKLLFRICKETTRL